MRNAANCLVTVLGLLAPLGGAGVICVDDDAPAGGNGQSWTTAFTFLQDALAVAQAGDEIHIAGGTYYPDRDALHPNGTADPWATFALITGVTLRGGYAGLADPNDADRRDLILFQSSLRGLSPWPSFTYSVMNANAVTAGMVDGVCVRDGFHLYYGGAAVEISGGELTFLDCEFVANSSFMGAAIRHSAQELTLVRCSIHDNSGRGILCVSGHLTGIDCSIHHNEGGQGPGGGIWFQGGTGNLTGCEVSHNIGGAYGGGLADGGPTVTSCRFEENYCSSLPLGSGNPEVPTGESKGGAIYGAGSITDCTFVGNHARHGGAVCEFDSITACTFDNNGAAFGGGAIICGYIPSADAEWQSRRTRAAQSDVVGKAGRWNHTITNCRFRGNQTGYGGAMYLGVDDVLIAGCTFESNHAAYGAAIEAYYSTIINSLFRQNSGDEGTIYAGGSTVSNCTFAENSATAGRALRGDYSTRVTNCILWDAGQEISYDYSDPPSVTYSDVSGGWPGTGNIDADPLFRDAVTGDLRLRFGSPCIDAGNNAACNWNYDLAGNPRRVDDPNTPDTGAGTPPIVDMGAYERMPLGDLNCDGAVDLADTDPFVAALSDPVAYTSAYPNCDWLHADCNNDGLVNFDDINPFVALLSGVGD